MCAMYLNIIVDGLNSNIILYYSSIFDVRIYDLQS